MPKPVGKKTIRERVMQYVVKNPENGCWEWQGSKDRDGYGRILMPNGSALRVHRASFQEFRGPIPDGYVIDHLCRNRACCNPNHLEPVTIKENTLRGEGVTAIKKRQTECIRGHDLTDPLNVYIRKNGARSCRACIVLGYRTKKGTLIE